MKKNELFNAIRFRRGNCLSYSALSAVVSELEDRVGGKRGAEDARDRFIAAINRYDAFRRDDRRYLTHTQRYANWVKRSAYSLGISAGVTPDEHGYTRGDYLSLSGIDFIPAWQSAASPYFDMGGAGLGLIEITRKRVYAKSSHWRPSSVATRFLTGRNEAGTYFTHPVPASCSTVLEAIDWIWAGKADRIIQRQGDIALISGNGGPKMPSNLPHGHRVVDNRIEHDTHPTLPVPSNPGERIIVGRRAAERASEATRD